MFDGDQDLIKVQNERQIANFKQGIRTSLDNLLRGSWKGQAELGARFAPAGDRVRVESVDVGSPAWEAGLLKGDQVVLFALAIFCMGAFVLYKGTPEWYAAKAQSPDQILLAASDAEDKLVQSLLPAVQQIRHPAESRRRGQMARR